MTEANLDVTFIKENLTQAELLQHVMIGATKALLTTAVVVGAVFAIQNASEAKDNIRNYVYISIVSGFILSLAFAINYYYGKIHRWSELLYTNAIESDDNAFALIFRGIHATLLALGIGAIAFLTQSYATELSQAGLCCVVTTGFLYYIYRKKLVDLKAYYFYASIGILAGMSAYLLGALIVVAIGLIGFWLTMGILALEGAFTAIYTYVGLCEWVNEEKDRRQRVAENNARREKEAAEKRAAKEAAELTVKDSMIRNA